MKSAEASLRHPWQPLTPPGVAAFATAPLRRLLAVEGVFALLAAVAMGTFLASAWFPTIRKAVGHLPPQGEIRGARLAWGGKSPALLANSEWLAITVDLKHEGAYRVPADLQIEFAEDSVRFLSLAGFVDVPYPKGWVIAFNESELGPWWRAREPFLVAGAALGGAMGLMILWALLAALYAIPAGLACRFVGHALPFGSVWKLCSAAQMPGCLLMCIALFLYSLRAIDLVQWLFAAGAHFAVAWIYVFLGLFFLPSGESRNGPKKNPFRKP